ATAGSPASARSRAPSTGSTAASSASRPASSTTSTIRACSSATRSRPWRGTASSTPTATPASGSAWTPTRTRSCSTTSGPRSGRTGRSGDGRRRRGPVAAVLSASRDRILERLGDEDLVLDVGGWAKPFPRADWVIDLMPYETRGLYDYDREAARAEERFSAETWVCRDICAREPWPFEDDMFDFAICSHTLEDVRD